MQILRTDQPYDRLEHEGITYSCCREFDWISRYRGLRQVIHNPDNLEDRSILLETPNPIESHLTDFIWHEVASNEVNRLDLIAYRYLGSAQYSWAIAYFNNIEDGYTCNTGQKLRIPRSISALMQSGEVLQNVTALKLNLGSE